MAQKRDGAFFLNNNNNNNNNRQRTFFLVMEDTNKKAFNWCYMEKKNHFQKGTFICPNLQKREKMKQNWVEVLDGGKKTDSKSAEKCYRGLMKRSYYL